MKSFLQRIKEKAAREPKKIVFPEGTEPRILRALSTILEEKLAHPILLGNRKMIQEAAKTTGLNLPWKQIEIIDTSTDSRQQRWKEQYQEIRKISPQQAEEEMTGNINIGGTLLVEQGEADGMISGATFTTAETIRPAIHIIGTKEKFHKVSGFFFMILGERILLFADCAVIIEPNSHELADIAIDTAETAIRFGLEPKIAMLSFSTAGSAHHPLVDKVKEATKMAQHQRPDLIIEGEMQVDAALVPDVCQRKFPNAKSYGDFNVLVFPDLQSGNISYKLVQRLAGAKAIGPIFQGLKKPINDLSRGCLVQDIVDLTAFTVVEAQGVEKVF